MRQACCADLNWGLLEMAGSIPIATLTSLPWVETFGSGKLGTPCARTQAEYATAWLPGDAELPCEPPAPEEELPEPAEEPLEPPEELLGDVLDPRCATVGFFAPPPHPATANASPTSPLVNSVVFMSWPSYLGVCLCCTRLPVTPP